MLNYMVLEVYVPLEVLFVVRSTIQVKKFVI